MPLYSNDLRINNPVIGGSANRVLFADSTQRFNVDVNLVYDNGNDWLGIGTTPSHRLHVNGAGAAYLTKFQGSSDGGFETYAPFAVFNTSGVVLFSAGGSGTEGPTGDYGYFSIKGYPTAADGIVGDLNWSNLQALAADKRVGTFRFAIGAGELDSYATLYTRDNTSGNFVENFRWHHSGKSGTNCDLLGSMPQAAVHAFPKASSDVVLIAQNASGQTANTFEQRDEFGAALSTIAPDGSLKVFGSLTLAQRTTVISIALDTNDHTMLADASAGAITITLPSAASHTGKVFVVKKKSTNANDVTVATTAAQNIDGATTYVLTGAQYPALKVQSDGAQWWII